MAKARPRRDEPIRTQEPIGAATAEDAGAPEFEGGRVERRMTNRAAGSSEDRVARESGRADEQGAAPRPAGAMPQGAGVSIAADLDRARIAHRAYELYMARGASDGQALDDWLAAERELADRGGRDR
jgi:hypothetical protein